MFTPSESATNQIRSSDLSVTISSASLSHYKSLQDLVIDVGQACSAIDGDTEQCPLHLVKFLETIRDKTWADIKSFLST